MNEVWLATKVVLVCKVKMVYLDCQAGLVHRARLAYLVQVVLKASRVTGRSLTNFLADQVLKVMSATLAWMECQACLVKLDRKDLLEPQDLQGLLAAKVTLVCLVMMVGREWMDYLDYLDRKVTLDSVVRARKVKRGCQVRRVRQDYLESRESKD